MLWDVLLKETNQRLGGNGNRSSCLSSHQPVDYFLTSQHTFSIKYDDHKLLGLASDL